MLLFHLDIFIYEISVHIFCSVFNWILLLLDFAFPLNILGTCFLADMEKHEFLLSWEALLFVLSGTF